MDVFEPLWPDGPVFCQAPHFRLSTDSVLLADFVPAGKCRRGIDLGCASGAILLLLLWRAGNLNMTGLELIPEAAALAEENLARNALSPRGSILQGDIRRYRDYFPTGSFDLVVTNPPYFPVGHGPAAPETGRANARSELSCSLEELCRAAAFLLKTGGRFCLVHKPERLAELFSVMSACGLEPKRLRPVCPRPGAAPSLVLVEGRRGGKPGLSFEPALLLSDATGGESAEYRRIYHRV